MTITGLQKYWPWRWSSFLLLILLVFLSPSRATQPAHEIQIAEDHCILNIITHPLVKRTYPGLLVKEEKDERPLRFLKEVDKFCSCTATEGADELELRKVDQMAYAFRDPKVQLDVKDQCALEHFDNEHLTLHYQLVLYSHFLPYIREKLKETGLQGIRRFVSEVGLQDHHQCLQEELLGRCGRIRGLRSTFLCLEKTISDSKQMDQLRQGCPGLVSKDQEWEYLKGRGQLI